MVQSCEHLDKSRALTKFGILPPNWPSFLGSWSLSSLFGFVCFEFCGYPVYLGSILGSGGFGGVSHYFVSSTKYETVLNMFCLVYRDVGLRVVFPVGKLSICVVASQNA